MAKELMRGNEALAEAAIRAGCKAFFLDIQLLRKTKFPVIWLNICLKRRFIFTSGK